MIFWQLIHTPSQSQTAQLLQPSNPFQVDPLLMRQTQFSGGHITFALCVRDFNSAAMIEK